MPHQKTPRTLLILDVLGAELLFHQYIRTVFVPEQSYLIDEDSMEMITAYDTSFNNVIHQFLAENFETSMSRNLRLFCEIPIDTLIAILSSKACNISSEFQLWILLHAWLKANFKEREKHIIDLLPHMKLGLILYLNIIVSSMT